MRPPASAPENRAHGAEKIGPIRYPDFFNRIGPSATSLDVRRLIAIGVKRTKLRRSKATLMTQS